LSPFRRIAGAFFWPMLLINAVLNGCLESKEKIAGRGSEAENEVHGVLVDVSGGVVSGARVIAYPVDTYVFSPQASRDSARTDRNGTYKLKGLQSGTYNLVGDFPEGSLAILISNVEYANGPALDMGVDTMKTPGSLEGRVLQGGSGKQGVMVFIPGTSYLAITDAAGYFRFAEIPEGLYVVKYQAPGLSSQTTPDIVVNAGMATHLQDKILGVDTAAPPPAPIGGIGVLDTLSGHVQLKWNRVDVEDILGYRVYREIGSLSLPLAISPILTDTFFTDANPVFSQSVKQEAKYRIRAVDQQLNEGVEYSLEIKVEWVSSSLVTTNLRMWQDLPPSGYWLVNKPLPIVVEYSNQTRRIEKMTWYVNDSISKVVSPGLSQGSDTLVVSWSTLGFQRIHVVAMDDAGNLWGVNHDLQVYSGIPTVNAGRDTTLTLGDSLALSSEAIDLFSKTIRWEWDIGGSGNFKEAPVGRMAIALPHEEKDEFPCISRVTNELGLIGTDTLIVTIIQDKPIARVLARTLEGFPGDTLSLTSKGSSDGRGFIMHYDWDVDPAIVIDHRNDGTIRLSSSRADTFSCRLRVTDDDGQSDTAQVEVRFLDNSRWAFWAADSLLQGIDRFVTWADDDTVWILGNSRDSIWSEALYLWSSVDMIHWSRSSARGLPTLSWTDPPVFHLGRIWMLQGIHEGTGLFHSENGRDWDLATASGLPINLHNIHLGAHDGKLWIFGVRYSAQAPKYEIWSSVNGDQWTRVTDNPDYGMLEPVATTSWNGRMWFYGYENIFPNPDVGLYSSVDGLKWNLESGGLFNGLRQSVQFIHYQSELWLASTQNAPMTFWGELMRSVDGTSWRERPLQAPIFSDYGYVRMLVFKNRIWLLSSSEDSNRDLKWEIWQGPLK
jgi:Carboxypeptidase regulatory-like domain